jgi:uncharacterized coiled-coil DUF342 family protein
MKRDEYVEKMKAQIDDWNGKLQQWEQEVDKAQSGAKAQYQAQIDTMRRQRDEAIKRLDEMRSASEAAWKDLSLGFENAWKSLADSFDKAWSEFKRKDHGKK